MATINVRCEVQEYETKAFPPPTVTVESDRIWNDRVWIATAKGERFCVIARQMITAIENATRTS